MSTEIKEQPLNKLTDLMRGEFVGAGFNEAATFGLVGDNDCFECLHHKADHSLLKTLENKHKYEVNLPAVVLANSKSKEFTTVRTTIIPSLLKTLNYNKHNSLPYKIFEVADVVVRCDKAETGSRNQRRMCAMVTAHNSQFEAIHGLFDHILMKLNCRHDVAIMEEEQAYAKKNEKPPKKRHNQKTYKLVASEDPAYLKGMSCDILIVEAGNLKVGTAGVLKPDVCDPEMNAELKPWSIKNPTTSVEINLEPFLDWLEGN